jgi:hypothetical protein
MTSKGLKKTRKQFRRDLAERQAKPKKLTLRLDFDLVAMIDAEALRRKWSRATTIETCIEFGLPDLERDAISERINVLSANKENNDEAGCDV